MPRWTSRFRAQEAHCSHRASKAYVKESLPPSALQADEMDDALLAQASVDGSGRARLEVGDASDELDGALAS